MDSTKQPRSYKNQLTKRKESNKMTEKQINLLNALFKGYHLTDKDLSNAVLLAKSLYDYGINKIVKDLT